MLLSLSSIYYSCKSSYENSFTTRTSDFLASDLLHFIDNQAIYSIDVYSQQALQGALWAHAFDNHDFYFSYAFVGATA